MQTWTIDEMLSHRPCSDYGRDRLAELWAGRERLSVLDVLDLAIPAEDRIWAALQAGEHVGPAVERIVRRAVENHAAKCGVPEVEAWAAKWLSGEDRSAAARAAWATAREAAKAATEAAKAATEWAAWEAWAAERAERAARAAAAERAARAAAAAWAAAREATWAAAAAWAAAREAAKAATEAAAAAWAAALAERRLQIEDIRAAVLACE